MKHKLIGLTITLFMTACSSTGTGKHIDISKMIPPVFEEPPVISKVVTPEWIAKGSGAYHDSSGDPVFYGLGSVSKDEKSQDRKVLSEDRARNELAKVFTSYMEQLVEKLSNSPSENPLQNINKEQLNSTIEERTATILMDSEISEHWEGLDMGEVYSLAELKLSHLTNKLDSFEYISEEDRSLLKESIVQVHASMTNTMEDQVASVEERVDAKPEIHRLLSY